MIEAFRGCQEIYPEVFIDSFEYIERWRARCQSFPMPSFQEMPLVEQYFLLSDLEDRQSEWQNYSVNKNKNMTKDHSLFHRPTGQVV